MFSGASSSPMMSPSSFTLCVARLEWYVPTLNGFSFMPLRSAMASFCTFALAADRAGFAFPGSGVSAPSARARHASAARRAAVGEPSRSARRGGTATPASAFASASHRISPVPRES